MQRNAFKVQLKHGCEAEYKKRHDEIWPEPSKAINDAGVSDYAIFLDEETLTLFAVQKLADNHTADQLPQLEMVGLHGGDHEHEPGQLASGPSVARGLPPALKVHPKAQSGRVRRVSLVTSTLALAIASPNAGTESINGDNS